jgi:hypothetical protein
LVDVDDSVITRICHAHPAIPWLLTGDFNVDAIPSSSYLYENYSLNARESEEYQHMMHLLSSGTGAEILDLLKFKEKGVHPSTRPPRIQFPSSARYMVSHKYPQRLDYILFSPGNALIIINILVRT